MAEGIMTNRNKKIYLTFDMEWGNDAVLEYLYELLKRYNVAATILVTHKTKWLDRFREDQEIELGIHPNFNKFLGGGIGGSYKSVIDELMKVVPEAVSYRSHTLTDSSLIISYCMKKGIKNNLNIYYFPEPNTDIRPYKRGDMAMIPFIFEDDIWMLEKDQKEIDYYLSDKFNMLRVFNFHPVHLYLNCENYDRYEKAKAYNQNPSMQELFRNVGEWGMEDVFLQLINQARTKGFEFGLIKEIGENMR